MKKTLVLACLFVAVISCTYSDDTVIQETEIAGTWTLVATLADPGDGSGTFRPNSGKTLIIHTDGTFTSNVDFCSRDIPATSNGTYDIDKQTMAVGNCNAGYEFNNQYLEIYFPCIEGCAERYSRTR